MADDPRLAVVVREFCADDCDYPATSIGEIPCSQLSVCNHMVARARKFLAALDAAAPPHVVTDAAVEAARTAYFEDKSGWVASRMRIALTAALPHLAVGPVQITSELRERMAWAVLDAAANAPPLDNWRLAAVDAVLALLPTVHRPEKAAESEPSFQNRVAEWVHECFGAEIAADRTERNHRFLEEALELVQSGGCTAGEAHQLVDYVFGRPAGDQRQEIGGVMVTLAALCSSFGHDLAQAAETELARCWTKVETIRAKQAAKPKHGPLPGPSEHAPTASPDLAALAEAAADWCGKTASDPLTVFLRAWAADRRRVQEAARAPMRYCSIAGDGKIGEVPLALRQLADLAAALAGDQ